MSAKSTEEYFEQLSYGLQSLRNPATTGEYTQLYEDLFELCTDLSHHLLSTSLDQERINVLDDYLDTMERDISYGAVATVRNEMAFDYALVILSELV